MTEEKPEIELEWPEIVSAIFASKGITKGLWRLAIKIRFAGVTMQFHDTNTPELNKTMPVAASGIEGIALFPVSEPGPMVFDAAVLTSPTEKVSTQVMKKATKTRSAPKKKLVAGH